VTRATAFARATRSRSPSTWPQHRVGAQTQHRERLAIERTGRVGTRVSAGVRRAGRSIDILAIAPDSASVGRRNSSETLAIYAASSINQLQKSSSAASQPNKSNKISDLQG
jgi:hypothetical protein